MSAICKIMSPEEWEATFGVGRPYMAVLEVDLRDGFIHCSTNDQLPTTLERFFEGVDELLIAVIDEEALTSELKWEPGKLSPDDLFPHIYGPINPEAVAGAHRVQRGADGKFDLPAELIGT